MEAECSEDPRRRGFTQCYLHQLADSGETPTAPVQIPDPYLAHHIAIALDKQAGFSYVNAKGLNVLGATIVCTVPEGTGNPSDKPSCTASSKTAAAVSNSPAPAQSEDWTKLCTPAEIAIQGCVLKGSGEWMAYCAPAGETLLQDESDNWATPTVSAMQFRLGRPANLEFEFPPSLANSRNAFWARQFAYPHGRHTEIVFRNGPGQYWYINQPIRNPSGGQEFVHALAIDKKDSQGNYQEIDVLYCDDHDSGPLKRGER